MATVLLVQSDAGLGGGWGVELESKGYQVYSAQGWEDGIARVAQGDIDVIVIDTPEPDSGLQGFVTGLDRMRDRPPFVLVSSNPLAPMMSAHLGAAAFLPKPCSLDEIDAAVGRLMPFRAVGTMQTQPRRTDIDTDTDC